MMKDNCVFTPYDVFTVEEIIGALLEECAFHYSSPKVEYNYGYNYRAVKANGCIYGYYVGVDRFCLLDGKWAKEYILYEYAVYDVTGKRKANDALYACLLEQAQSLGCSRILYGKEGGNDTFYSYFTKKGFVNEGDYCVLPLPNAKLPEKDEAIMPVEGEKLPFEQLYFLREQNFLVDEKILRFAFEKEEITICRQSGECRFPKGFTVVGGEQFLLDSQRALSVVDICCQLLEQGVKENVKIYLPNAKAKETDADVLVGEWGIFITEEPMTMLEKRTVLDKLREEDVLERVSFYSFYFDFEVGGRQLNLHYLLLKKK